MRKQNIYQCENCKRYWSAARLPLRCPGCNALRLTKVTLPKTITGRTLPTLADIKLPPRPTKSRRARKAIPRRPKVRKRGPAYGHKKIAAAFDKKYT